MVAPQTRGRVSVVTSVWTALIGALLLAISGCSSPSSPTPPPTTTTTTTTTVPPTTTTTTIPSAPPLTITCPADVTTVSFTGAAVSVTFPAPTTTGGVSPVQVICNRASGSAFPVGATPVQCTATDAAATTRACTFTVTVTAQTARLTRTRFLAFGDSLTAGEITAPTTTSRAGEPNYPLVIVPSASYPTVLANMLRARYVSQAASIEVINAGLSGEWAEDGMLRLPGVLNTNRPEVVLLLEGVNDLGVVPNGPANAGRAIETMAQTVRARGARLFLATLPPSRPGGFRSVPNSLIMSLNSRIRLIAPSEGAVLVDVYPVFEADVTRYIGIDGLHPTEAGYQKLAELFFNAIRGDLEVR
jgi:lysophospholipase L1-like esterase